MLANAGYIKDVLSTLKTRIENTKTKVTIKKVYYADDIIKEANLLLSKIAVLNDMLNDENLDEEFIKNAIEAISVAEENIERNM